jgi:HK97 family phage major capsid protein
VRGGLWEGRGSLANQIRLWAAPFSFVNRSGRSHGESAKGNKLMTIQELRTERKRLADQAEEILAKARTENRDVNAEEEKQFEAIHVDIEKLRKQIEREERQADVLSSLEQSAGRRSEPSQPEQRGHEHRGGVGRITSDDRLHAMRSWLLAGSDIERTQEMREAGARCGLNLDQRALTFKLPRVAPRSLRAEDLKAWEERAALGTTSGSVGGYTVPDEAMRALEVSMLAFGGMRQVATIIRTDSGADLPIPTSDDTSNKGAILSENSPASEQGITFGQLVLNAFKYTSKYVLVSVEFLQDSSLNVAEFIGRALGERIGRITNDHFTTGDNSSKPNGIVTASSLGVTATSLTATTTFSFMMDLVHSIDPAYRTNARFMMSDAALKMVRKILIPQYSGDTAGAPLWQPGMVAGAPDTIFGYPYTINQSMTAPSTGVKSIIFGDLSKYLIRDVRDITLLRLDERFAEYHQVAFLAFSRHDGDLLDAGTDPVKHHLQG